MHAKLATTALTFLAVLLAMSVPRGANGQQSEKVGEPASWSPLTVKQAKSLFDDSLKDAAEEVKVQAEALWDVTGNDAPVDLLERAALTAALMDEQARQLVSKCAANADEAQFIEPSWEKLNSPLSDNVRLYFARWLVGRNLFDEAKEQIDAVKLDKVVDPAALLFYQSVISHRLLDKKQCVASTDKLLENAETIPRRYEQLARLMAADIKPLEPDSPDEIARLMDDVERRLDLGRAGKRVRKEEDEIVAKLDKLIKKIEEELKKRQQQQQQAGGQGGQPAEDSRAVAQSGAGDVESKDHDSRRKWGDLPPETRRSTLQQISRELGAHYREVVEEYFRKIAQDSD